MNKGQGLISIIVILVVVGLVISSAMYFYFANQIPEISKYTKTSIDEEIIPSPKSVPSSESTVYEEIIPSPKSVPSSEPIVYEEIIPSPKSVPSSEPIKLINNTCSIVFQNGSPSTKINIYFYEDGYNSDAEVYNNYIRKIVNKIFSGSFEQENFSGIEPFKSLKNEFNVFSFSDDASDNYTKGQYGLVSEDLKQNCSGFVKPTEWGVSNGNYNIIVVVSNKSGRVSTSSSTNRLNETTIRKSSADMILLRGMNLYNVDRDPLPHELGHRIGYFDEEYSFYDLYLGAKTTSPNIDSFSCTKWCQGVDTQSTCYKEYVKWIDCFKTKTVDKSNEIQDILQNNNLNYTTPGNYDWWGICFSGKNISICGEKISHVILTYIRPYIFEANKDPDQEWVSDWEYCKSAHPNVAGPGACSIGLNCEQDTGCYPGTSYSRFLASPEDQFIMGRDTRTAHKYNAYDEEILRYNILNKVRYIDVENIQQ